MKLALPILAFLTLLLASCTTYKTVNTYHHFTNEFDVVGQVQNPKIEVYHQIINDNLAIRMVNISDTNYLFNWSKSTVSINDRIITAGNGTTTTLIPPSKMFEVNIPLVEELKRQGIQLNNTAQPIVIKTYLTWSNMEEDQIYTNTYSLNRVRVDDKPSQKQGANTIAQSRIIEEISGGATFITLAGSVILLAILIDSTEE